MSLDIEDIEDMFGPWGVVVVASLIIVCLGGLVHLGLRWAGAEMDEPNSGIITEMEHDWEDGTYCIWYENEYQGEGDDCISKNEYEHLNVGDEYTKEDG